MAVVVTPLGVQCNLQCGYCYENPQRDAGNLGGDYNIEVMKAAIEREGGGPFLLFGGEPLLLPRDVLQNLWAWGLERYGRNVLQTNGTLLDDGHVDLFRRYKVNVGISVDGPEDLNDARWQGTLEKTRAATSRTQQAIVRLCREGMPPSLIVILHRLNASAGALSRLEAWFRGLAELGVRHVGLHLLEVESEEVRSRFGLSIDENVNALLRLRQLETEVGRIEFSLLRDMENLLLGDDSNAKCIWRGCDPYTTSSVRGVGGHGERTKCGRTIKDGVDSLRAASPGFERYLVLYQTPFDAGGCRGCRFFAMCRGQCPGTAINRDWRNRSEQCPVWFRLFERLEKDLLSAGREPISVSPRRARVEMEMIRNWEAGRNMTMSAILKSAAGATAPTQ